MKQLSFRATKYACYTAYIVQATVNNLTPLLLLSIQRSFDISSEQLGFMLAYNFCVQIIVDYVAAGITDRIGYRAGVIIACALSALGLCSIGALPFILPSPFVGLMIAVTLYAMGGGFIEVLVSPIVEALPGDEKASAMSILHSFYCWGQVAVVLLTTLYFLLAGGERWYILPFLWAIVPLFNILLFAFVPFGRLVEEGQEMSAKELFGSRDFLLFIVMMLCAGACELSVSQWSSYFAETGLRVSKATGDLLGPCAFAILMGLARVLSAKFGNAKLLPKLLLASGILCTASYAIIIFAPHPILSLCGCALCGLSVGLMWPGTYSIASERFPRGGNAMFGFLALAGDLGASAGPYIVGLCGAGSLKVGFLAAASFPVLMVIVCTIRLVSLKSANRTSK